MPDSQATLDTMAGEIFELYQLVATARTRRPSGPDELSETEFLTLDVLSKEQPLTTGEVQKRVGVLPAQMSGIVRALEKGGGKSFVACSINSKDRRRIDIILTEEGRAAYASFRAARLASMRQILAILAGEDRMHFMRIIRLLTTGLRQHFAAEAAKTPPQPVQ